MDEAQKVELGAFLGNGAESRTTVNYFPTNLLPGILALLCAVVVASGIYLVNDIWPDQNKKIVLICGAFFGSLLLLFPAAYIVARRGASKISEIGLIAVGTVCTILIACYLYWASFEILFPADILIWSESDFVNDILKFRQGYPLFTEQANNESFTYPPGSQLLTYFLAWLTGNSASVPAYRMAQVFYTLLATIIAFLCCRRVVTLGFGAESRIGQTPWWGIVWFTGLFLIATNKITNPFTHLLHNDALALLTTVTGYWLLLEYEATKDKRILWLMALIPVAGFWVKQSLVIWTVIYSGYLLIFDAPRSFKRVTLFSLGTFGGVFALFAVGYLLWGNEFFYWLFTVLGKHGVTPSVSFDHLLEIRVYLAMGLIGGAIMLQSVGFRKLLPHWLIWLFLILTQTYTSGVATMLNHIGPGSLIAGIWFFAGAAAIGTRIEDAELRTPSLKPWLTNSLSAAVLLLVLSGLAVIRPPVRTFSPDTERYVRGIENEIAGQPLETTLLDMGTWVYFQDGVVMKDRAPTVGERGFSETGDFSGILQRLEQKYYTKILIRNLHSPDFWYDHKSWKTSTGLREALLDNYTEVGKIEPPEGIKQGALPYGLTEVSILVPREN